MDFVFLRLWACPRDAYGIHVTGYVLFQCRVRPLQANPVLRLSTQVQARVLYVELSTRLVALSLRSYLVQAGSVVDPSPAAGDRIGEVVKDCKMTTMHHMSGAMLELPDETMAFVHVS